MPAELVEEVQQEDHVVLRFLRSLRRDGGHQRHDAPPIPRAKLYVPYLRFVEAFAPVALLMENVPDVLNYGGHSLGEDLLREASTNDYRPAGNRARGVRLCPQCCLADSTVWYTARSNAS